MNFVHRMEAINAITLSATVFVLFRDKTNFNEYLSINSIQSSQTSHIDRNNLLIFFLNITSK